MFSSFTFVHFSPPSSERKTPPFSASTIAKTRPSLAGEGATPIFPRVPSGRPSVSFFHVSPPSVVRQRPLPGPPLTSSHGWRATCQKPA